MPSFQQLYDFIKHNYRHDRFEGSHLCKVYPYYTTIIVDGYMRDLQEDGFGILGKFESTFGRDMRFNKNLEITEY